MIIRSEDFRALTNLAGAELIKTLSLYTFLLTHVNRKVRHFMVLILSFALACRVVCKEIEMEIV